MYINITVTGESAKWKTMHDAYKNKNKFNKILEGMCIFRSTHNQHRERDKEKESANTFTLTNST